MKFTGLSEWTILRTQAWKDHAERQLDAYLRPRPEAQTRDVQNALGISRSKASTMRAWKEHLERQKAARSRRRVEDRERPLTQAVLDCRADESAPDPATIVSQQEQIFRKVLEQADRDTRAALNGLRGLERDALVDHLLRSVDDGGAEGRGPEATLAILVEVARSWLEERGEEGRRARRRGGRRDAG